MKHQYKEISQEFVGPRAELDVDVFPQHEVHALEPAFDPLQSALTRAGQALLARQAQDGHWRFDLEADATIPSEYMLTGPATSARRLRSISR
jgi:hypothetical protein